MNDAAVLVSVTLQRGVTPAELGWSIGCLHDRSASIVGSLVDLLVESAT